MANPRERVGEGGGDAAIIDRSAALELSASLAHENRREFAQTFSAAITASYAEACTGRRPALGGARTALSVEVLATAGRIAEGMVTLPPAEAAYAIGTLYTSLLPETFRAQHGIFYTPPELVECLLAMAENAGIDWKTARVLDPACGGGAFLVGAAARMMSALGGVEPAIALQSIAARLRGFELDPFGAWLAQEMVGVVLQPLRPARQNLPAFVDKRDSLELKAGDADAYDLVIGNPPYGRVTLAPERRARFARSVYGHANLYGVFTEAALHWTKRGGIVGYVTPTSMLSGLYYKALRAFLAAEAPPLAVNFVSERDGVFADVLQETMLATYRKGGTAASAATVGFIDMAGRGKIRSRKAGRFTLPTKKHSPWLLPRAAEQAALTTRLRSMPHRLADYGYGVSTGPLVWNRHKEQFQTKPAAGGFPVIWAESVTSDGRFLWRSEKRNHAPWFAAKRPKDDWLIVTQPCVLVQRTTAKEQARRLIAAELPESFIRRHRGVIVENHLNMVRALEKAPAVPAAVIAALLGSAVVDAAFRCLNGSVAVSAFELEELPLPGPATMTKLARLVAAAAPPAKIEAAIAAAYGRCNAAAAA
jgi:adenine-specific DNA-methyltransferase